MMPIAISKRPTKPVNSTKTSHPKGTGRPAPADLETEWLTVQQVAAQLQVTPKTALKIIERKDIPVRRIGGRRQIRIHRSHVDLFLDKDW